MFENFQSIVETIDFAINTDRKRHIVGGLLLSVSALFGGLAITAMTLGKEEKKEEKNG